MDSRPRDGLAPRPRRAVAVSDRPFAAMLRAGLISTVIALPVIVIVFWVARGTDGGLAAAIGALVAIAFFAAGLLVMQRITNDNPMTVMAGALAVYLGQVIFLGIVILSLGSADWVDGVAFGVAVLAVALIWQVAQVFAFMRLRQPVYDEPADAPDDSSTGEAS